VQWWIISPIITLLSKTQWKASISCFFHQFGVSPIWVLLVSEKEKNAQEFVKRMEKPIYWMMLR